MANEQAQRIAKLFGGNEDAHGTHGVPDRDPDGLKWTIKRTAQTLRGGATDEMWQDHLSGKTPLGIIPIRKDNTCVWGSIDFDEYDVDLLEIIQRVVAAKLPLIPCRSKSGGLHLFIFLQEPQLAAEVQDALKTVAASLGLAQCEIFPKQRQILADRGDAGNWMVVPYFGGDFKGKLKWQHGLTIHGMDMVLSQFLAVAEKSLVDSAQLAELTKPPVHVHKNGVAVASKKRKRGEADVAEDFGNGPPCLQNLTSSPLTEGRKRSLFMMALYYWRADRTNWKKHVEDANAKYMKPALPVEEVAGVIRSLTKKEGSGDQYQYKCKEEPFCSHCNSSVCRTRKYGVGNGDSYPQISGLAKLDTEPAIWFVDVNGARLQLSTQELQNYVKFHAACMEKGNIVYSTMTQGAWLGLLGELMQSVSILEAPSDIGLDGQFFNHLAEFLTNRIKGQMREDLLADRPWEDEDAGRHYFTLRALQKFLQREKFEETNMGRISQRIRKLGGSDYQLYVKGASSSKLCVWWVASNLITPPSELPPPQIKEEKPI